MSAGTTHPEPGSSAFEPELEAIEPPVGRRCKWPDCGQPATAVAVRTRAEWSCPTVYCALHGRAAEELARRFCRHVVYFPVCAADGCGELATRPTLARVGPTRSEYRLVCDAHRGGG